MVDTGKKYVPWDLQIRGKLLGLPDIYGNRNADSSAAIEFRTSDNFYLTTGGNPLLAKDTPGFDGDFAVTSINHVAALDSLYLRIKNAFTGATHDHKIILEFATNVGFVTPVTYDIGEVQVPWSFDRPLISRLNGHDFRYPADFARSLIQMLNPFNSRCQIQLLRTAGGKPDADIVLDRAFKTLETESLSKTGSGLTEHFVAELNRVLNLNPFKFRRATEFFRLALEQFANPTFNTEKNSKFHAFNLAQALSKAFGFGFQMPFFDLLQGRAGFFVLLFLGGFVANGNSVMVSFNEEIVTTPAGDIGYHVTNISS